MEKTSNKWFKFITLYLGAVVLSMSQLKITPIFNEISHHLGISSTQTSLLMSVFTFSALFLALPSGGLISKHGVKKVSVWIMACLCLGNIIGIFAQTYNILLMSRVVEGISFAMINLVGIVFINHWFSDGSRGVAIGIFGTFSATASLLAMNIYRPIYIQFGLKSVWFFTALLAGLATILYSIVFDEVTEEHENQASLKEALSNKYIWFLAFSMGTSSFVLFTFLGIYPKLLMDIQGLEPVRANSYSGFFGLFGLPFGLLAGVLTDKTKRPGLIAFLSNILIFISSLAILKISKDRVLLQIFLLSAAISMNTTSVNISLQSVVKKPILLGYSLSIMYLFYYVGTFVGPPITTKLMELFNWTASIWILALVSVLGAGSLFYYICTHERKNGGINNV